MSAPHRQGDVSSRGGSSRERESVNVTRKKTGSSGRDDARMIGQWRIGRTIGKGSSGRVKIAKHAITGKYAAIKIVPKGLILTSRMSVSEAGARADKVMLGIEREIVIMKLIDHPNVLNLYDVWETSSELYLIMEYVPGGELFDYLVKRGRLPVSEALHYFQQIIHAVDYCHRFNICHRDLKPENLLLDKDKNIKVADFGMAAWEAGERMLETSCGSPHYASPEIVAGKAYHGSSSDIWSCGIILFALLTGRLPFDDDNIRSLLQKVKVGVFEMPDEIQNPARDLLSRMLEKDPERRITMPDILQHPFFVSRPPRGIPGRQFVAPPSLDEVERPVNSPEEIDADIMGNLKTLWSGASDEEIISELMSKEKTWEKAIYHLLIKYRNKHLENYNMDDEEDAEARARRQARREREGRSAPSPAKRKGGAPQPMGGSRLTPLSENETIQDRTSPPRARPSAPTPKKAAGGEDEENTSPESKLPKHLVPPGGPRPNPAPQRASYASSNDSHMTPSIVLQEATPTKELVAGNLVNRRSIDPPSTSIPSTPQLGTSPLNVPLVQDEQLQHFFNEVANQLNTMNIRSSVASNSSTSTTAALGTDYHAYMAYLNHGTGSTPVSPVLETAEHELGMETVDPNQFADADDDETELASVYSHTAPSIIHSTPHSPLVGLGFGQPPPMTRPGLYPSGHASSAATNPHRWSYASSAGSSRHGPETPSQLFAPGPWSPHPETGLQAQRAAPAPPPRIAHRPAPPPPSMTRPRPLSGVSTGESLLKRDESYVVIDGSDVPASDSSWGSKQSGFSAHRGAHDAFGMLKKRKKVVTIDPIPYSSELSGPPTNSSVFSNYSSTSTANSTSSPKRSWFNNLFSFKPASCTLLSHDNIQNSREKVRRHLLDMGVKVSIVEIEGLKGLKCRLDEIVSGSDKTVLKGVRFRIEFTNSAVTHNSNTLVILTQEKGAQSSFKNIFNMLKTQFEHPTRPSPSSAGPQSIMRNDRDMLAAPPVRWTHSAPNSPVMASTPRFTPSPRLPGSAQLPTAIRM